MVRIFIFLFFLCMSPALFAATEPKNVVLILADDLGWSDTSLFLQSDFYETPNIERLAKQGVTFRNAYTNSPLCSPTRATILTGQTPARHGSTEPNHHLPIVRLHPAYPENTSTNRKTSSPMTATRLDTRLPTLSKLLKNAGFQTAHFGKWHLGPSPFSPLEHGFDIDIPHYAGLGPSGGYLAPWSFAPNLTPQQPGEHIDIRLAQEASQWISDVKDDGPFFLNFWAFSVHAPFNADEELTNYFKEKRSSYHSQRSAVYAAMVKQFDDSIGVLLDTLEEQELLDNTIIIFSSDNGGNMYDVLGSIRPTSNFPLRGGKATHFEGGIRVPTIIYWPGLTSQSFVSSAPIQTADFYPTILRGLNIDWPESHQVDGSDIRPLLTNDSISDRPIITFYPAHPSVPDWLPPSATITQNNWKLIKTFLYGINSEHLYQLFNLQNDIAEQTNLANRYPEKVAELEFVLDQYLLESKALLPIANERYQPGSFNYDTMGTPLGRWKIPLKNSENLPPVIDIAGSHTIAQSGDTVTLTYRVTDEINTTSANYKQFMGPPVTLTSTASGELQFAAPTSYTQQTIGIAFVASDNIQTTSQTWQVQIEPTNVSPTLKLSSTQQNVAKGETLTIDVKFEDANKQHLSVNATSPAVVVDIPTISGPGQYDIQIPSTFNQDSYALTLEVSDGEFTVQDSIEITVTEKQNARRDSSSGGGALSFWLVLIYLIRVLLLQKHSKMRIVQWVR